MFKKLWYYKDVRKLTDKEKDDLICEYKHYCELNQIEITKNSFNELIDDIIKVFSEDFIQYNQDYYYLDTRLTGMLEITRYKGPDRKFVNSKDTIKFIKDRDDIKFYSKGAIIKRYYEEVEQFINKLFKFGYIIELS